MFTFGEMHGFLENYNLKVSPEKSKSRVWKVNQLLLPGTNKWNENLIRKVRYQRDADWILELKLPEEDSRDLYTWHYDRSGNFTVKSAYKLAYNLNHGVRWFPSGSSHSDNFRPTWKPIWAAKIPSKVKIFEWRVACINLATKKNKFKRTLETDSACTICARNEENSYHAILDCTKPRALRFAMRTHW
jgi:hypothetical protein